MRFLRFLLAPNNAVCHLKYPHTGLNKNPNFLSFKGKNKMADTDSRMGTVVIIKVPTWTTMDLNMWGMFSFLLPYMASCKRPAFLQLLCQHVSRARLGYLLVDQIRIFVVVFRVVQQQREFAKTLATVRLFTLKLSRLGAAATDSVRSIQQTSSGFFDDVTDDRLIFQFNVLGRRKWICQH